MKGGAKAGRPAKIAKARAMEKSASEPGEENGSAAPGQPASAKAASKIAPAKPAHDGPDEVASPGRAGTGSARPAATGTVPPGTFAVSRPATVDPDDPDAPPVRDEMLAPRDVGRLLHYGERLGSDTIDIRMLPLQLHIGSGSLAVFDPAVPASWHVLDRPIGRGAFRVMLSVARPDAGSEGEHGERRAERLAAVVIHAGRPPIARWTVAHFQGQAAPSSPDALPRTQATSGWIALLDAGDGSPGVLALPPPQGLSPIEVPLTDGRRAIALPCNRGEFAAYWAVDAVDHPICVVLYLDAFPQRAWKAKAT